MRPLNAHEIQVVTAVSAKIQTDLRARLLNDLNFAEVDDTNSSEEIVLFTIKGYQRPKYEGQHTYGVDGAVEDCDGAKISILLFADPADHLLEMELIRWDGEPVRGPKWHTLIVDKSVTAKPA